MRLSKPLLIWALLPLSMAMGCRRQAPDTVILIVVDTLRADHLSLYGYDRATSPELVEWATRGLVFEHAFAPSPWTLPTFGSVLTGLWPGQHSAGARSRGDSRRWRRSPLSPAVATLPEIMQQNGFTTGAIVNNAFLREHFGAARGFDHYDYERDRSARVVIDLAKDWMSEHARDPFFLMIHLIDPHLPYEPPRGFLGRFGDVPEEAIQPRGRKKIVGRLPELTAVDKKSLKDRYDEEIAFVDEELGRLFSYLEELGLSDRALLILTSDHGEELFDHGGFEHGHSMFQEVLRVPLVFWGPGIRTGRESVPVSLVDLAPTIYEATGLSVGRDLAGVSLWDVLQADRRPARREILAQNTLWGGERESIVSWPFKLIHESRSGHQSLYDLSSDPEELRDLADEQAAVAQRLQNRLLALLALLEANPTEPGLDLTDEMEEELRALGYLD